MVKAILEDRKTMTRRLEGLKEINKNPDDYRFIRFDNWNRGSIFQCKTNRFFIKSPYLIGQKLWVRETFYKFTGISHSGFKNDIRFFATDPVDESNFQTASIWLKKSPLFLPKKYARIWLEVTDIRVERVNDISYDDAISEGLYKEWDNTKYWYAINENANMSPYPQKVFRELWDSIHKNKPEYLWDKNCYVWVITFKRIKE